MIKTNELRIRNLVNSKNDGIISITNISEKSVAVSEAHCYNHIPVEFISPIPLTDEWLLKLGFKKNGRDWELPNFRFHVNKPINYNGFVFCDGYTVITEKIQYVHQLQNLYFALTGAELTVA